MLRTIIFHENPRVVESPLIFLKRRKKEKPVLRSSLHSLIPPSSLFSLSFSLSFPLPINQHTHIYFHYIFTQTRKHTLIPDLFFNK